ncbi:MAG: putative toxin-antitoxin system toxin component, PIN family [Coriobacteriia bacterium]|nr:putative toxin-antitoxin system toxin component, PIN family [Coriobacteriia bacterium]
MSRLVLDTNVLISAYGFGGKPAELMRAIIDGQHGLITSPALLTEFADKLYDVLGYDDDRVRAALQQLARLAEMIRPEVTLHVIADEADNRVLECAVEGGAEMIVSGDHHLLDLGEYEGVPIVRVSSLIIG